MFLRAFQKTGRCLALSFLTLFYTFSTQAQDSLPIAFSTNFSGNIKYQQADSVVYPYNKKRIRSVAIANIAGYTASLTGLSVLWYANEPRSSFHFFNDNKQWLQMDKAGHVFTAYTVSNASMEMWRWTGLDRKNRIILGALGGIGYQSIIEILDGFSSEYGFSAGDFGANVLGAAIFAGQELAWNEQRFSLKFSVHSKEYAGQDLQSRAKKLYGETQIERFLKDYNGQSYWLSANIHAFVPESRLPEWLNISVGYGAEGMFGGTQNIARDEQGNVVFDRRDVGRYRQWYLAPDLDLTRIKTNKKGVKILLFVLNSFKFPTPGLELSNGKIKGRWLIF